MSHIKEARLVTEMIVMINKSIIEEAYRISIVTEKTIEEIKRHPRFYRFHARTVLGRLYTDEEFKKRSDRILNAEMP